MRILGAAALATCLSYPLSAQDPLEGVGFVLGDANAPITIVEFGDFGCPACAEFAVETFPALRAELVAQGRVRWQLIPMALGFRHSKRALQAALCADEQDAFWPMHDALFAEQQRWQRERNPQSVFRQFAAALRLDVEAFEQCYPRRDVSDRIKELTRLGRRYDIPGTPAFLVQVRWIYGAHPPEVFRDAVAR